MAAAGLSTAERAALDALTTDLRRVFGARLQSVVAYGTAALTDAGGEPLHALALADSVTVTDLTACAPLMHQWRRAGLATPLLLSSEEFRRTLDVFPVEYGAIIDSHVVVYGSNPFAGCAVCEADLRRAVELQAKSHLIHLREGFLEAAGQPDRIARLLSASLPAYRSLVDNLRRLDGDLEHNERSEALAREIGAGSSIADPTALFERYLADVERIWRQVDAWRA